MDPQVPTQRALAIAGERIAGGVGVHETALASPDVVDLGGRVVVPGFVDAHVHFPSWALARREVSLDGCSSLAEALERGRAATPADGGLIRGYGWRSGDWPRGERADRRRSRHGDRRDAGGARLEGPPLPLAQQRVARAGPRRPRGRRRGRRARPPRRAGGRAARAGRVALPRAPPRSRRRRVPRRDAGGASPRGQQGRDGAPRQGRGARRPRALAAARALGIAEPAGLAVAAGGARRRAAGASDRGRLRRPAASARVPQGVHGRGARLAHRGDARRLGREDHEQRGARRYDPQRGGRGRLPGRGARDRRPGEPRRARRLRAHARDVGAARPAPARRARPAALHRRPAPVRLARGGLLGAVLARSVRPRPRRQALGREDRRRLRLPLAARIRRAARERLRRADRGA